MSSASRSRRKTFSHQQWPVTPRCLRLDIFGIARSHASGKQVEGGRGQAVGFQHHRLPADLGNDDPAPQLFGQRLARFPLRTHPAVLGLMSIQRMADGDRGTVAAADQHHRTTLRQRHD